MAGNETLSIAMATFNAEKFLRDQLKSLVLQSHLPDELVVTDDCSTDQTLQILKEFQAAAPFPVRVSVNEERMGYADNFLRAAGECHGDLIAFCDHDDVWMENKLERCLREFQSRDVSLVAHALIEVDSDLKPIGYSPSIRRSCTISRGSETPGMRWSLGCAEVVRREVVHELLACWPPEHQQLAARFDRKLLGHDEIGYFVANGMGDIRFIAEPLIRYRVHGSNATNSLPTLRRRMEFSAGVGRDAYDRHARFSQMQARLLRRMADASGRPALSDVFRREAREFMAAAACSKIRSKIYGEHGRLKRLLFIAEAGRRGLYGRKGTRSIAKDLAVAMMRGAAEPQPKTLPLMNTDRSTDKH